MNRHPMTVKGAHALQKELNHLKTTERQRIVKAIAEARAHGDLKENAEYHAAKEQQGFIEGRIREIEGKLSMSQVIDISKLPNTGKVIFGTTVHLNNIETDTKVHYHIVGEDEADLKFNKISYSSPIARALIGKETGDVATVHAPSGNIQFDIEQVEHLSEDNERTAT